MTRTILYSLVVSKAYNHKVIEANWKTHWFEDNIYKAEDFSKKSKKYILAELPYPSGDYLHVGHMMRYTVPEIYSRFLRMQGNNVLFPMGWDSFGLPAETNAIKTNRTPQNVIKEATPNFKKSMQDMGYAIDWSREIDTSDPKFYKWTQWMFLKMWEKGLVVQKEMPVWWCKELGVLADEEVLTDNKSPTGKKSERGGYPVHRKNLKQWVLKITDYADRLLQDLDKVDYTESIKIGQKNWIGRKEGINIDYPIKNSDDMITCFTTRPDTNFGATFIVIAPEHFFAKKIAKTDHDVSEYINTTSKKTYVERQENKEKTGVFTGSFATNRLNGKELPIWISDFVLGNYGTGAVVAVPGHDKRDHEFAEKFNLEIIKVVKNGKNINSDFLNGLDTATAIKKMNGYLEKKGWGKKAITYNLGDQVWSRQRYWGEPIPLVYKEDGTIEGDYELPVLLPVLENFLPEDGKAPLNKIPEWVNTTKNGVPVKRETDTMPTWAGSNWYYLRYLDPNNEKTFCDKKKLKYWMPVDKYFGDAGHTTAHLLYTRFWYKFLYDIGEVPTNEPIQHRINGGLLLSADNKKMSKSRPKFVVSPKDVINNYGADATRVYLAFIGPYEETYPWNEDGIKACYKFSKNVYDLRNKVVNSINDTNITHAYHKMLKRVTSMCPNLKMNTSVAEFMKFMNETKKVDEIDREIYLGFIKVVAPFAPFVAEELWQELNSYKKWKPENSVHLQDWPKYSEALSKDETVTVGVQINGKIRGEIEIYNNEPESSVKEKVLNNNRLTKYFDESSIKRFIYVPGKIISIVI